MYIYLSMLGLGHPIFDVIPDYLVESCDTLLAPSPAGADRACEMMGDNSVACSYMCSAEGSYFITSNGASRNLTSNCSTSSDYSPVPDCSCESSTR